MNDEIIARLIAENQEYRECIESLIETNNALIDEVNRLNSMHNNMCQNMNELVNIVTRIDERVQINFRNNKVLYNRICNLPYEILDQRVIDKYRVPQIMTEEETIDAIVFGKKSIARFGDGEFGIMFGVSRWRFQRNDSRLAARLREVVTSQDDNILIGINNFYGDLSHRTESEADGIRDYITPEIRSQHMELLSLDRVYAHACISRTGTWEKVQNQKRIWEGKNCVFIEGDKTRMGVGNDLFDNAKSIQRILCPSENAFDRYDEILKVAENTSKDKTILIALGPTASVLAYDLAKLGYHAIDIGHADISYEWLLRNGGKRTAVKNKYNNEWDEGYIVEDIVDEVYTSQIIADLS